MCEKKKNLRILLVEDEVITAMQLKADLILMDINLQEKWTVSKRLYASANSIPSPSFSSPVTTTRASSCALKPSNRCGI